MNETKILKRNDIMNVLGGTRSKLNKGRADVMQHRAVLAKIADATHGRSLTQAESDAARATIKALMAAWHSYGYEGLLPH
jgi:hypothetical protein